MDKRAAVGPHNWFEMKAPIKGTVYSSASLRTRLRVELYIDSGDGEKNLEIFEHPSEPPGADRAGLRRTAFVGGAAG